MPQSVRQASVLYTQLQNTGLQNKDQPLYSVIYNLINGLLNVQAINSTTVEVIAGLTFLPGSIIYAGADGKITQDNANLFYDYTNKRLGIGTTAPANVIVAQQNGNSDALIQIKRTSGTLADWTIGSPAIQSYLGFLASGIAKAVLTTAGKMGIGTTTPGFDLHIQGDTNAFASTAFRLENINSGASAYALFDFVAGTNVFRGFVPSQGVTDQTAYMGTSSAIDFSLMSGNAGRWTIKAAGHLVPVVDNTYDIGTTALRIKNLISTLITEGGALNLGTSEVDGVVLQNTTAASGGTPFQYSPRLRFLGAGWTGAVSEALEFSAIMRVNNSGSTNPLATLAFGWQRAGGGFNNALTVDSDGNGTITKSLLSGTGGFIASAAGYIYWNTRATMRSPADGQFSFEQNSGATGFGLDANTASVMKVRTAAHGAYGTVDCLGLAASGAAGANFTGAITNLTVVNGIVTAAS